MASRPFVSRFRPVCGLLLAAGMLCWLGEGTRAEAKTHKKRPPEPIESPTPVPDGTEPKKGGIDIPIPINHSAQGVCFPIWTGGKLQMRYNMEIAYRVDAEQLRLTQLKLETFDENGKSEMVNDKPQSMLNLQTRIITSADPVTVRRTDLELVGQNMTFDTQTRQGKFVGPVRVLIYQQENEAELPKTPKSPEPTQPAAAQPSPASSPASE